MPICENTEDASTIAPSNNTGGSTAIIEPISSLRGAKSSIAVWSRVSDARKVSCIASNSHGPANLSHAAPTSTPTAVARSRERTTSPFLAASFLRFSVGAKDFSPSVSAIARAPYCASSAAAWPTAVAEMSTIMSVNIGAAAISAAMPASTPAGRPSENRLRLGADRLIMPVVI